MVFLGYYHGQKKPAYENPVRTNQIHRQIPEQQWFMNSMTSMLMAGILPFGAVFIELFFIFTGNISIILRQKFLPPRPKGFLASIQIHK